MSASTSDGHSVGKTPDGHSVGKTPDDRLVELGLELPPPVELPAGMRAAFIPARRSGELLFLSGSGPLRGAEVVHRGKLGVDLDVEEGYAAARLTGLNLLATIRAELGALDAVARWVKVLGMVNSGPGFDRQPAVIDGFSHLIVDVYGEERGAHARSAVGMAELPFGIPVEIEAIVELR
jgi:enamine deaminase RidA (YjgF/YER057c/UK114 family)